MQEALIEEYGEEFFVEHWTTWMVIMKRLYTHFDGEFCEKVLHKIKCPTFILHGAKDLIVLEKHAHFLHKNIPHSKYNL